MFVEKRCEMITENLPTLQIHKLSKAQYERELASGRIDENALYLTPDNTTDDGENLPTVTKNDNGKVLQVVDGAWAAAELPVYDGAYYVTPSAQVDQTLQTAQKLMDSDIKIIKIPYAEVSNNSGGKTASIG
jgi:hypothetical protein